MKVISSIFVAFIMFLTLGISANANLEIFGIGSFSGRLIPCDPICECVGDECIPCCGDTFETDQISPFLGESALYQIDPNTGNPLFIGFTGFGGCRGLEIHPLNGDFYAVCNRFEIGPPGPPGMMKLNEEEDDGQVLVSSPQN